MPPQHPRPRPRPRPETTPRPPTDPGRGPDDGPRTDPGRRPQAGPGPDPRDRATPSPNLTNRSVVAAGGRRALAAVTGETGRRLARAVGLTVVLAVLVTALYDRGELPTAAARQAVRPSAGGAQGGSVARAAARREGPVEPGGLRGRDRVAKVGERPAAVAAAWYAARHGVPRARVKPLQQDRLSAKEIRVLVLADHGHGRLRTALVRLRHGSDGWSVR